MPTKTCPPAERRLQDAAKRGRHHRRERRDRAHAGELAPGTHPLIEVADDGARQHRRAGDAERLQAAQNDQHLDRGCKHAAQADRDIERQRGEQHRLAADMVGDRSEHDLADGEAEQVARQGELHLRHRGAEYPPELRQRGQIEVDRHRTDRGQQRQQRGQRQGVGTQHRDLIKLRPRKFIRPMRNDGSVPPAWRRAQCWRAARAAPGTCAGGLRWLWSADRAGQKRDRSCGRRRFRCRWRRADGTAHNDADRCRWRRATPWRARPRDRADSPSARTAANG